jgi:hypothetical protein
MAIEPINLSGFSRNPIGIEQILARGTSAFSAILQTAAQVGRDQANNQATAERDFLTERQRAINLDERRGADLLAQQNADRRFAEDQRQFDVKFGESTRQFDSQLQQTDFSRIQRDKELSLREKDMGVDNALARDRFDLDKEDLALRRTEAVKDRGVKTEYDKARLEALQLDIKNAKDRESATKAKTAYDTAKVAEQSKALATMDELIRGGKMDEAKQFYRTHIEHPSLDFPSDTKNRFATQIGITPDTTKGVSTGSVKPVNDLSPEELDAEIQALEGAVADGGSGGPKYGTQVDQLGERTAVRLSQLRERQKALKEGPSFMEVYRRK